MCTCRRRVPWTFQIPHATQRLLMTLCWNVLVRENEKRRIFFEKIFLFHLYLHFIKFFINFYIFRIYHFHFISSYLYTFLFLLFAFYYLYFPLFYIYLGTLNQLMALRPEKGASAVNNRMTEAIKDKYGVKR